MGSFHIKSRHRSADNTLPDDPPLFDIRTKLGGDPPHAHQHHSLDLTIPKVGKCACVHVAAGAESTPHRIRRHGLKAKGQRTTRWSVGEDRYMKEFVEERARVLRSIADRADPFTKRRLLALAQRYENETWRPAKPSRDIQVGSTLPVMGIPTAER